MTTALFRDLPEAGFCGSGFDDRAAGLYNKLVRIAFAAADDSDIAGCFEAAGFYFFGLVGFGNQLK